MDFQVAEAVVMKGRQAEQAAMKEQTAQRERDDWKHSPVGSGTPGQG